MSGTNGVPPVGQQNNGPSQQELDLINQGVTQLAAGFLLLLNGEQKKIQSETAAEINK